MRYFRGYLKIFSVIFLFIIFLLATSISAEALIDSIELNSNASSIENSEGLIVNKEILNGNLTPKFESKKIDGFLRNKLSESNELIPLLVHVGEYNPGKMQELKAIGAQIKYEYNLIPVVALSIEQVQVDVLANLPFVTKIEFDAETQASLPQSTVQIGVPYIRSQYQRFGKDVRVAVIDTGIDNEHEDLENVILEKDFTGEGTDDLNGHGTHVASIVAGTGKLTTGVNRGIAPKSSLIDVKVLDRTGQGRISDLIAGIEYSVLNKAQVISISLGAAIPCTGLDAGSLMADAAVEQGVNVVVAAGNLGPLPGTITSPGCAKNVITVGAVDKLDNLASFSSRGPTLDGRTKPEIVAPGVLIIAAEAGSSYAIKSGTSMAAPHISGVIALLLEEKNELKPEEIKNILQETAFDIKEDRNGQGAGRVQAYEAFLAVKGFNPEEAKKQKEATEKAQNESEIKEIKSVSEKERDGNEYYVVEGIRESENGDEIILVWVNKETGEIDFTEELGFFKRLWASIIKFLSGIVS